MQRFLNYSPYAQKKATGGTLPRYRLSIVSVPHPLLGEGNPLLMMNVCVWINARRSPLIYDVLLRGVKPILFYRFWMPYAHGIRVYLHVYGGLVDTYVSWKYPYYIKIFVNSNFRTAKIQISRKLHYRFLKNCGYVL